MSTLQFSPFRKKTSSAQSLTFQDLKAGGLATVLVAGSVELPTKVGSALLARVPFSASAKGGGKKL